MENADKRRISIPGRSDGDGMEFTQYTEHQHTELQRVNKYQSSRSKYSKNFLPSEKRKEPKFIPYEPYKAAVSPIISSTKKFESMPSHIVIDSQKVSSIASSVIQFDSCKEFNSILKSRDETCFIATIKKSDFENRCNKGCVEKLNEFEERIKMLEEENKDLHLQFQVQTEVNADLKKLLIASLGEDMQLKMQYMTEDKARLGMNVIRFSEELGQKNEEIEKLSALCDVWKSKFEASSVLVDELACWKDALSQQLNHTVFSLKSLLKEHKIISDQLCTTYNILQSIQTAFNTHSQIVTKWDHAPENLLQLTKEIYNLSILIEEKLLGGSCRRNLLFSDKSVPVYSPTEVNALKILEEYDKLPLLINSELNGHLKLNPRKVACQILPHICSNETTVNCCKQCSGEIQLL